MTIKDVVPGTHNPVATTYAGLAKDAREGDRLLIDDGKIALRVRETDDTDLVCEVPEGGPVSDHKGMSLPGMNVSVPARGARDLNRGEAPDSDAGRRRG